MGSASPEGQAARGGTLRVGFIVADDADEMGVRAMLLDPQAFIVHPIFRCCLTRTLLSYTGRPAAEGGWQLRPDLAESLPEVSPDGLTWTFRLRDGLRYGPPLTDRDIVSDDFVTALEETIRRGESPYFDAVVGVSEFRDGTSGTISGVRAPDPRTVVFELSEPLGDFGNRLALAYVAPLPAEAVSRPGEPPTFVVSSGPYTLEGAENIDLDDPPAEPIWREGELGALSLVRNPSWQPMSDSLRTAYVDRIELVPVSDEDEGIAAVERDELDLLWDPLTKQARDEIVADDSARRRVHDAGLPAVFYVPMNVAAPPFDDQTVRRAANVVMDRAALTAEIGRGEFFSGFTVARHAFPDAVVAGLLRDYAPFATPGDRGDPRLARELMAESSHDTDGDGRCDGDACTVTANAFAVPDAALEIVRDSLAEIGIAVEYVDDRRAFDPAARIGMFVTAGWILDYPNASDFAPTVTAPGLDSPNFSLVGASADQLATWGYDVAGVPSLDDKVATCRSRTGSGATACWAELDQLLSEQVAAWIPIAHPFAGWLTSRRVDRFSIDGSGSMPALDAISMVTGER